jgi:ubiquinone/menaquinone biosynthesis C-methylase UbiE
MGIDLGCAEEGGTGLVTFRRGDAEAIPFADGSFDVVICECAFCTFPDKSAAAREFARVLREGGRVGVSDLTRTGALPEDLDGLLAWIACIADARPVDEYVRYLEGAGFRAAQREAHDDALLAMAHDIQGRLLGLELMSGLKKIDLTGIDLTQAKQFARSALEAIRGGLLGYALITAEIGC